MQSSIPNGAVDTSSAPTQRDVTPCLASIVWTQERAAGAHALMERLTGQQCGGAGACPVESSALASSDSDHGVRRQSLAHIDAPESFEDVIEVATDPGDELWQGGRWSVIVRRIFTPGTRPVLPEGPWHVCTTHTGNGRGFNVWPTTDGLGLFRDALEQASELADELNRY